MYDVTSIGIIVSDIIIKPATRFPKPGELIPIDSLELYSGGNAMTAALNLKKAGLSPGLIGKIGNDFFGNFLLECLENNNISTKGIKISENAQTSASAAFVYDDGERSFMHCKGANADLNLEDIDFDVIKNSNIIFITGSFVLDSLDGDQTVELLKECKRMGKTTALDVCWNKGADFRWLVNDAMKYIDLFMPSIDEAKMISEKTNIQKAAEIFLKNGVGSVIIKCGSEGCYISDGKSGGMKIPALKVNAVDTTGAGDSFCSGFLAGYSKGFDIIKSAVIGNAAGACCVAKKGATTGMPGFEELLKISEEIQL